jgi:hypothetical protein
MILINVLKVIKMKKNLNELSLTDLKTLRDLLKDGVVDGYSSQIIAVEAEGYQFGHEKWKERKDKRSEQLKKIDKAIREKANEYDF